MTYLIIFAVIALLCAPLAILWSLNVLFGMGIAYTVKTYIAAAILAGALSSSAGRSSK